MSFQPWSLSTRPGVSRRCTVVRRPAGIGQRNRCRTATGPGLTILIGEGVATVLSASEATGYLVIAALSSSNLLAVAKAMSQRFPAAILVFLADLGNGQNPPIKRHGAVGAGAVPNFGENRPEGATDFNDMHQHRGLEAVAECIATQMAAHAVQEDVQAAKQTRRPRPRPRPSPDRPISATHTVSRRITGSNIHYCWPWSKWLVWNERCWSSDDTGEVHRLAEKTVRAMYTETGQPSPERREASRQWALKCEAHERRAKMLASAQAIAGIPILPENMDRDPWWLNVRNGTIDLRTGKLRAHARKDLITRGLDVDYDPDAMCPTWEGFIDVFGSNAETIAFVQRALGYSPHRRYRARAYSSCMALAPTGKQPLSTAFTIF